jgi:nucleoside 2-deoxyribosyltransferase
MNLRAYLAGPDVFLREAEAFASVKHQLCTRYGFTGVSSADNIIDFSGLSKREAALVIARTNESPHQNSKSLASLPAVAPMRQPHEGSCLRRRTPSGSAGFDSS